MTYAHIEVIRFLAICFAVGAVLGAAVASRKELNHG